MKKNILHIYKDTDGFVIRIDSGSRKVFFTLEELIRALKKYPNLEEFELEVEPELFPKVINRLK